VTTATGTVVRSPEDPVETESEIIVCTWSVGATVFPSFRTGAAIVNISPLPAVTVASGVGCCPRAGFAGTCWAGGVGTRGASEGTVPGTGVTIVTGTLTTWPAGFVDTVDEMIVVTPVAGVIGEGLTSTKTTGVGEGSLLTGVTTDIEGTVTGNSGATLGGDEGETEGCANTEGMETGGVATDTEKDCTSETGFEIDGIAGVERDDETMLGGVTLIMGIMLDEILIEEGLVDDTGVVED